MADTKFTPGPWSAEEPMEGWLVRADDPNRAGKRFLICDIGPSHRSRADEIQAHANARLIAAAPDLYGEAKALADMIEALGHDVNDTIAHHTSRVRAALAKARGEQ